MSAVLDAPQEISGQAIVTVDYRRGGTSERPHDAFATLDAAGAVRLSRAETKKNLQTEQGRKTVVSTDLRALPAGAAATSILMNEGADQIYLAAVDGTVYRFDARDAGAPKLAETRRLLAGEATLGAFTFLNGDQSLVIGGSDGTLDVYCRRRRDKAETTDGYTLVRAHALESQPGGVVAVAASQRTKILATADARGGVWLRHSTSEQTLLKMAGEGRPAALALSPRDNGIATLAGEGGGHLTAWDVSAPHPETTLRTIFGPVWYEGYDAPGYTWQSSSGTDSFEPKLSLVPLIFGTLKATICSLLFAVPIAILAAIYTSEFVHRSVRAVVKPAME